MFSYRHLPLVQTSKSTAYLGQRCCGGCDFVDIAKSMSLDAPTLRSGVQRIQYGWTIGRRTPGALQRNLGSDSAPSNRCARVVPPVERFPIHCQGK
jgi:hypothetical protein